MFSSTPLTSLYHLIVRLNYSLEYFFLELLIDIIAQIKYLLFQMSLISQHNGLRRLYPREYCYIVKSIEQAHYEWQNTLRQQHFSQQMQILCKVKYLQFLMKKVYILQVQECMKFYWILQQMVQQQLLHLMRYLLKKRGNKR